MFFKILKYLATLVTKDAFLILAAIPFIPFCTCVATFESKVDVGTWGLNLFQRDFKKIKYLAMLVNKVAF